jgi:peptidylprolyl isomerase
LFDDITPLTSKNFLALCVGSHKSPTTGKPLHYKGCSFHRIIPDFMVQGGDITSGNGRGGESIYGASFKDENFIVKHDKPFLLSMANCGKDTNSSQFFLTTVVCDWLDDKHTVFGQVIDGKNVVKKIEEEGTSKGVPLRNVIISNCGQI